MSSLSGAPLRIETGIRVFSKHEKMVELKNKPDLGAAKIRQPIGAECRDVYSVNEHLAAGGRVECP